MAKQKKPAPKKGGEKKAAPKKKARKSVTKLTERQADQLAADKMRADSFASTQPKHPTVEEQYAAAKDAYTRTLGDAESQELHRALKALEPPKKPTLWARFRSAITGLLVSKKYAEANPDTTVRERVKP